ncbi:pseudouridine synthase [Lipingzhangella halophila]|uniref:Pseudouridine synthase n=1 Tax=Lipingzhangella halophila TaxID=1783352 RepID=A0A7W7W1K0_9ACTN|nr:pseudouridine synthase [Lipingzhangella halophila]MBB4931062.1 pseudouridine synthase [Lipingzhangella halophila]
MNAPRENPKSRGERGSNDQRGERGRSAPRGERGAGSGGKGGPKRRDDKAPERKGAKERGGNRRDGAARGGTGNRETKNDKSAPANRRDGGAGERQTKGGPKGRDDKAPERKGAKERGADRREGAARGGTGERQTKPDKGSPAYRRGGGGKEQRPGSGDRTGQGEQTGKQSESRLSVAARERLAALRADYEPGDGDLPDDRDEYQDVPGGIRLQKALAQAGVASRRASEEMIAAGRVTVDGHLVRRFGARVDPNTSEVRVDGMRVATAPDLMYYALNKPRGVVSTMWDPEGRRTLADYTGQTEERLFHVGRLDTETEGLILLTNDGELANRLTHPRYKVVKTYVAKVPGPVPRGVVTQVRKGVELEDGPVKADSFRVLENLEPKALVEVQLHEGRKRIVRRLLDAVGHPVHELARTRIGPIGLNALKPGTVRVLTAKEVSELYTAAGM